jgi:membrane-associated phospholipid phosphatase
MMLSWQQAAVLSAGLGVVGGALRMSKSPRVRAVAAFVIESCIVAVLFTIWQLAAKLSLVSTDDAIGRARWIERFERTLHLPNERTVQNLILGHAKVIQAANLYYAIMHFTIMFVFLLWLFLRYRHRYSAVRTTLAMATLTCLVIQFVPVAPPRLLGRYVDTALAYGQSVYSGNFADELSAMPSVHVMWAVLIGWYVWRISPSRWRWIGPLHAVVTIFVVVATGNHWWMDGIVGVLVLIACAWLRLGIVAAWKRLTAGRSGATPAPAEEQPEPAAV